MCSSCETVPLKSRIRARAGALSVVTPDVLAEAGEVGPVELRDRALVLLHAPGPEVEVDRGHAVLNRCPERPPVLRHEAPEAGAGDLVCKRPPVVMLHQLLELLEREV